MEFCYNFSCLTACIDSFSHGLVSPVHISFAPDISLVSFRVQGPRGCSSLWSTFPNPILVLPFPPEAKNNCNNWMSTLNTHFSTNSITVHLYLIYLSHSCYWGALWAYQPGSWAQHPQFFHWRAIPTTEGCNLAEPFTTNSCSTSTKAEKLQRENNYRMAFILKVPQESYLIVRPPACTSLRINLCASNLRASLNLARGLCFAQTVWPPVETAYLNQFRYTYGKASQRN